MMSSSSPVSDAFWTSAYSVLQVLTIIAAGAAATHNGIFEPSVRKAFAVFNIYIFFPCMCLGTSGFYDASAVLRYLPLTAVAAFLVNVVLIVGVTILGTKLADRSQCVSYPVRSL